MRVSRVLPPASQKEVECRHHTRYSMHDFSFNPTSTHKEGNSIPILGIRKMRLGRLLVQALGGLTKEMICFV